MARRTIVHDGEGNYKYSIVHLAEGEAPPVNEAGNSPPITFAPSGAYYIDSPYAAWRKDMVRRRRVTGSGRADFRNRNRPELSDRNRKWAHKP